MKHNLLWTMIAALMLSPATLALAAAAQVVDNAGFFSTDAVNKANQELASIHDQYGKDLRIETYPSIPDDLRNQYSAQRQNQFYAGWAYKRAHAAGVNGAIVIITRNPAHLQVDVGDETRRQAFTIDDRDRLRDTLVTNFKAKNYDQGLASAVDVWRTALQNNGVTASAHSGSASPSSANPPARTTSHGFSFGKIIFWGAIIFLGLMFVRMLIGRRSASYPGSGYAPGQQPYDSGYGTRGGMGTGFGSGILGGLLGSWIGGRIFGGGYGGYGATQPPPPVDPSGGGGNFDSGPADFSGSEGGYQDIGGGGDFGGGGGDIGGGGDMGGGGGGDFA